MINLIPEPKQLTELGGYTKKLDKFELAAPCRLKEEELSW